MAKQMHYTKEGYQALVEELEYLKTTRRAEVKEALATARSYGDLSENSEYDEARNEQAKTEVIFAKNRNGQVGSVDMRYVGHLMKFEDVQPAFYESAMNSNQAVPAQRPVDRRQIPYQQPAEQPPYNPFDEFAHTEFV